MELSQLSPGPVGVTSAFDMPGSQDGTNQGGAAGATVDFPVDTRFSPLALIKLFEEITGFDLEGLLEEWAQKTMLLVDGAVCLRLKEIFVTRFGWRTANRLLQLN